MQPLKIDTVFSNNKETNYETNMKNIIIYFTKRNDYIFHERAKRLHAFSIFLINLFINNHKNLDK